VTTGGGETSGQSRRGCEALRLCGRAIRGQPPDQEERGDGAATLLLSAPHIFATIDTWTVYVYDRHPSQDVVCTLQPVDVSGVPIGEPLSASSSGSEANVQVLTLEPFRSAPTISLRCTLPPGTSSGYSHLTTYRVIGTR
jgi:hypothetical protein